jgi:hypothetical protein
MTPARMLFAGLAALAALSGCSGIRTTVPARLDIFINALNSDRASIYASFDPAATQQYSTLSGSAGMAYWDASWPVPGTGGLPYSVSLISYSDPANITCTVYGPGSFDQAQKGLSATFVMILVETDYFIRGVSIPDAATPIDIH